MGPVTIQFHVADFQESTRPTGSICIADGLGDVPLLVCHNVGY
jgi:hypothetical protein